MIPLWAEGVVELAVGLVILYAVIPRGEEKMLKLYEIRPLIMINPEQVVGLIGIGNETSIYTVGSSQPIVVSLPIQKVARNLIGASK